MTELAPVVFLLGVDNTLLDNSVPPSRQRQLKDEQASEKTIS